ncbi:MAG: type II toxin-antitoxin system HicB family antitoxin [Candidatus Bipolaricaulia bacterium]
MKERIYGYVFAIIVEKGETGWIAYAPGVGGVYEEGRTREEAKANAYRAACAILDVRWERNDLITTENQYLHILRALPDQDYISKIGIKEGYIATLPCAATA